MLLAEAVCVFVGFILCISGVLGQANSICALKGSSVDLPCSAEHPTSSMKWFTVYENGSNYVCMDELSADGNHVTYNMSEESNYTLTIKDLRESDAKFYCCMKTTDTPEHCWLNRTELHVADLQVKVIPATEGEAVTLICNTSCSLTENPAEYIWYKNREFLYQDWSPWYQQLVSSEEAVRYSCAVKGYEHLRAPEVSVDSVTSTCFTVTYAEGRMCPDNQTLDKPCSITYPQKVDVQQTSEKNYVKLTCATSCAMADPHTAYRLYIGTQLYSDCEMQDITILGGFSETFSCAIKGNEDLCSAEVCITNKHCRRGNYVSRRICALEGSSVNISAEYSDNLQQVSKLWYKIERGGHKDAESVINNTGRVAYHDNIKNHHTLTINSLQKSDSAEYTLRIKQHYIEWRMAMDSDLHGVILVVTGLRVRFNPSAVVTEGQRVTLTCSTSCPLANDTNYIWYLNSQPLTLPESQNKHLALDPVSMQHAGNYSCAVKTPQNISSSEKTLTVKAQEKSVAIINAVKIIIFLVMLSAVLLLYMWIRKRKTLTSAGEPSDIAQTGQMYSHYDSITLMAMNPAAQREPAEQQEDTV